MAKGIRMFRYGKDHRKVINFSLTKIAHDNLKREATENNISASELLERYGRSLNPCDNVNSNKTA